VTGDGGWRNTDNLLLQRGRPVVSDRSPWRPAGAPVTGVTFRRRDAAQQLASHLETNGLLKLITGAQKTAGDDQ
jgi:hypothetical protein